MMKKLDNFNFFLAVCLLIDSCVSFKSAKADEGVTYEADCEPPTMCSLWADCVKFCENLSWEDVEATVHLSDEASYDDLRESCLFVCDENYIPNPHWDESTQTCH